MVVPFRVVVVLEVRLENAPVEAVVAPTVVPLIEPPVIAILERFTELAELAAAVAELLALVAAVDAVLAEPAAAVALAEAASASAWTSIASSRTNKASLAESATASPAPPAPRYILIYTPCLVLMHSRNTLKQTP
jgi:hypothetical protein